MWSLNIFIKAANTHNAYELAYTKLYYGAMTSLHLFSFYR